MTDSTNPPRTAKQIADDCKRRIKQPTVQQIADSMINGIGIEVAWTFSGTKLTPAQLRTRAATAGLDPDAIAEIDPVDGLKRAVAEYRRRDGRATIAKSELVSSDREITATGEVVVGILYRTRESDTELAHRQRETLIWNVASSSWDATGTSDEANELRRRVAIRQEFYDGNDVRDRLIMPALKAAQTVKSRRGAYYVPLVNLDKLLALEAAVADLEGFKLDPCGVESGQGGDARMGQSAVEAIGDSLSKLEDQIEGWIDQPRAPGEDTEEHVMGRFDELSSMARLYESSLQIKLDDLQDLIADMRQVASDRIHDKREDAKDRRAARNAPAAPVDRRAKLAAMDDAQLATIWGFKIGADVDMPTDRDELLDQLLAAMVASEADEAAAK